MGKNKKGKKELWHILQVGIEQDLEEKMQSFQHVGSKDKKIYGKQTGVIIIMDDQSLLRSTSK